MGRDDVGEIPDSVLIYRVGMWSRSRRPIRARFSWTSHHLKSEVAGKCRGRAAPAVSCATCTKETHTSIQVQRRHPGIPCAMVLRLITRSPRRRIPFATVIRGLKVLRNPVGPANLRGLDTSNGCQDHTP